MGYNGCRIGEASNPGPVLSDEIDIISCNVNSLSRHMDEVLGWGAAAYLLQETRITDRLRDFAVDHFKEKGFALHTGAPVPGARNEHDLHGGPEGVAIAIAEQHMGPPMPRSVFAAGV